MYATLRLHVSPLFDELFVLVIWQLIDIQYTNCCGPIVMAHISPYHINIICAAAEYNEK